MNIGVIATQQRVLLFRETKKKRIEIETLNQELQVNQS